MARIGAIVGVLLLLGIGVAVAAEAGLKLSHTTGTWRYKMIVEVETPEGIKTGSAVREAKIVIAHPEVQGLNDTQGFVKGEAVAVDLGKRGLLFAVLDTDDYRMAFHAFPDHSGGLTEKGIKDYQALAKNHAVGDLSVDHYPLLVRFADINDPKSIERVIETEAYETHRPTGGFWHHQRITKDRFEEFYGKGVKLKDIRIEMTEEPVTMVVKRYLKWLPYYYDQRFDGDKSTAFFVNAPLSNQMGSGYFSTEINK